MSNANFLRANATGYDEFDTQLDMIEIQLSHYKSILYVRWFIATVIFLTNPDLKEKLFT